MERAIDDFPPRAHKGLLQQVVSAGPHAAGADDHVGCLAINPAQRNGQIPAGIGNRAEIPGYPTG